MGRARRHPRVASSGAFFLLALVAELVGRSVTRHVDVGRHISSPSYATADLYPFLLVAVKLGVALLLARLAWRFSKAHATARAARRLAIRVDAPPRLRLACPPRLWASSFVLTSAVYLVHTDAEGVAAGRWAALAPLLHTSALSVFALLSVVVAVLWAAVTGWLAEYESYAEAALAKAQRLVDVRAALPVPERRSTPPRRLFGLAFEVRPPPLAA